MDCAIYTRVSTDNQAEVEFNSCQAQEAKVRAFIESQEDFRVFKVYEDGGFSGANLERPQLQAMLEDIRDKKVNVVVVYKIDRLTRLPKDFYHLVELFEKHGVDFISVTERFDTSTLPVQEFNPKFLRDPLLFRPQSPQKRPALPNRLSRFIIVSYGIIGRMSLESSYRQNILCTFSMHIGRAVFRRLSTAFRAKFYAHFWLYAHGFWP